MRAILWMSPALISAGALGQEVVWTIQGSEPPNVAILSAPYVVGDVDRDGYEDLMLGVNSSFPLSTQLWVVSGRDASIQRIFLNAGIYGAAGDIDVDGAPDYVASAGGFAGLRFLDVRSAVDNRCIWQVQGVSAEWFGSAVEGKLDLDGDQRTDLLVGAQRESNYAGGTWAYRNDGSLYYHVTALPGLSDVGHSLARVGDVDADGCDDYVSGAFDVVAQLGVAALFSGRTG